jgi:hypothetical protein
VPFRIVQYCPCWLNLREALASDRCHRLWKIAYLDEQNGFSLSTPRKLGPLFVVITDADPNLKAVCGLVYDRTSSPRVRRKHLNVM